MRTIAAVVIVLILLSQNVTARSDPLIDPESFFYPVKIWIEKFSLNFVFNQTEKTQKMLDMTDERLKEAEIAANNSKAFENAMKEYTDQLEELHDTIEKDTENRTENIRMDIKRKIEEQRNRTDALISNGKIKIVQQNIIEASSSSMENRIEVNVVDGNVSVYTEGGNATITKEGNSVIVTSVTNNSNQHVIVRSSNNKSYSSSVVVRSNSNVSSNVSSNVIVRNQ